jgi:hypothetical protein
MLARRGSLTLAPDATRPSCRWAESRYLDISGIAIQDPLELAAVQCPAAPLALLSSLVERLAQPPVERRSTGGIGGPRHARQPAMEVDQGRDLVGAGTGDSDRHPPAAWMRRAGRHSERASPRIERDRPDHPVGRECVVDCEPRGLSRVGCIMASGPRTDDHIEHARQGLGPPQVRIDTRVVAREARRVSHPHLASCPRDDRKCCAK